jgi:hypothetical protein
MGNNDMGHNGSMGSASRNDSSVGRSPKNEMGIDGSSVRQDPQATNVEPEANGSNRGHESNEKH